MYNAGFSKYRFGTGDGSTGPTYTEVNRVDAGSSIQGLPCLASSISLPRQENEPHDSIRFHPVFFFLYIYLLTMR
jgi:hypothetical protein